MRLAEVWPTLKETAVDWNDDNAARLAAALSYYTLLSVAPIVVLAISIAGLVFGHDAAQGRISNEIASVVGTQAGEAIQTIASSAQSRTTGIISSLIGVVVLLFGASGVFGELQAALNSIWRVEPKPGRGAWGLVKDRFFSFTMVLGVGFLLLVSLLLTAGLAAAGKFLGSSLPGGELLWSVINFAVSFGVVTALFALIFKVVPDARIRWHDVWIGAVATALLFTLGKMLLGYYLGRPGITSSYGAAGSIVALVVWVYYSSQILFLGAEFTQVYARRYGATIRPSANAVSAEPGAQKQKSVAGAPPVATH